MFKAVVKAGGGKCKPLGTVLQNLSADRGVVMKNKRKILEFIMAVTMLLLVYICAGRLPVLNVNSDKVMADKEEEKKIVLLDAGHGEKGVRPKNNGVC